MKIATESFSVLDKPLAELRRFVEGHARDAGFDADATEDLVLAVWEAVVHVATHTLDASYIELDWLTERHEVEIRVQGRGAYTDEERPAGATDLGTALSMAIETALLDQVVVEPGTADNPVTVVRLVRRRDA